MTNLETPYQFYYKDTIENREAVTELIESPDWNGTILGSRRYLLNFT